MSYSVVDAGAGAFLVDGAGALHDGVGVVLRYVTGLVVYLLSRLDAGWPQGHVVRQQRVVALKDGVIGGSRAALKLQ